MSQKESCSKCGKEKRSSNSGSLTQWILDQRYCACDKIAEGIENEPRIECCQECAKPLASPRHGSITQWIFRATTCACQSPAVRSDPGATFQETTQKSESSNSVPDEKELLLDKSQFPAERYKAISRLGKGASGSVYLCRDRLLGIKVAVKTLHVLDKEQLIAFQNEARATSRLNHPAILKLLDFGPTESGAPYMVLEYFDGTSLADWIKEHGLLSARATVEIFGQIVSALSLAHTQGIFHRDLKPTNILVTAKTSSQLEVKLIDFGIAAIRQSTNESIALTQGDTIAGTPAYMPPDVLKGKKFDRRSEVYSVGCVLYECLSGRTPFLTETALEMMRLHGEAPVPPLNVPGAQTVNPELERLVLKCLEKDPEERYQSMEELGLELEQISHEIEREKVDASISTSEHEPTRARPPYNANRPWLISAIVGSTSLLLIGFYFVSNFVVIPEEATKKSTPKFDSRGWPISKESEQTTTAEPAHKEMKATFTEAASQQDLETTASAGDAVALRKLGERYYKGVGVPRDATKAFQSAAKAANAGDAEAQNMVAFMYEEGDGIERDKSKAFYWFGEAAKQENTQALLSRGRMLRDGIGTKQDFKAAFDCYRKAVALGSQAGKHQLAFMYLRGLGVKKDYARARKLYQEASEAGDDAATCTLGYIYMSGLGVPKDFERAAKLFKKSADAGNLDAHSYLGLLNAQGQGMPTDLAKAAAHYKYASDRGHGTATNHLATMYKTGKFGKEHIHEAIPLYKLAIRQGCAKATANLGLMYQDGLGCKKDMAEAMRLFRLAAEQGDEWGQTQLAFAYMGKHGIAPDYDAAIHWLSLAAKQGSIGALNNLGTMYLQGKGVEKNYEKAYRYLSEAADRAGANAENLANLASPHINLGYMCEHGLGTPLDPKKAFNHYSFAARAGLVVGEHGVGRCYEQGIGVTKDLKAAKLWYGKAAAKGFSPSKNRYLSLP